MRKRQLVFLASLILCAGWLVSMRYYRLSPVSASASDGFYTYTFKHYFSEKDILKFHPEQKNSYIEIHFSNHFIIRYVDETAAADILPVLARWEDRIGRTRVTPVVTIRMRFDKTNCLAVGKEYLLYAGSITRGLKLEKIISGSPLRSVHLVSMPFYSACDRGSSFLRLAGEFPLRKIERPATIEDSHVQTWEYAYPSKDGKHLAVSSFDGYVYYMDIKGKLLWHYHIPDGKLSCVSMSNDGRYVFVGEHSADGNVYCLSADNGRLIWRYSTARDVGSFHDSLPEPGLWSGMVKPNVRDVVSAGDTVFARSRRTRIVETNGRREKIKISKIYAFSQDSGAVKWAYPKEGNIERYTSSSLSVSDDGRYASLVIFEWETGVNPKAMVFDAASGDLLWEYQCDAPVRYFKTPTCYSGLVFSPDSRYAAMALNDGRMIILDNRESIAERKGVVRNTFYLVSPIEVGSVPVMTYMSRQMFTRDNELIVTTGQTYTTPLAQVRIPPVIHPNASSVFVLDIDGNLLWRFTAGGNPSMFDMRSCGEKEYLAISFAHNVNSQDVNEHGLYVFDVKREGGSFSKVKAFYHTEGICVAAQLSPDLRRLFVIEAVIDTDDSIKLDYRGKHRVIFFDLDDK